MRRASASRWAALSLGMRFRLRRVPAEGRLDEQAVQIFQDMLAGRLLAAPPGGDGGHFQFLAEQMLAQAGQKRHEGRALQQAGAQGVGDGDVARAHGLQQAGHAKDGIVAQFQRIAKIVVHAAENDVDRLQAAQGFEIDAVVAHGQVLALDEHVTEIAGEVTLLEISFVVGAGGEKNDARIVLLAQRPGERARSACREKIQPSDGRGNRGTVRAARAK